MNSRIERMRDWLQVGLQHVEQAKIEPRHLDKSLNAIEHLLKAVEGELVQIERETESLQRRLAKLRFEKEE